MNLDGHVDEWQSVGQQPAVMAWGLGRRGHHGDFGGINTRTNRPDMQIRYTVVTLLLDGVSDRIPDFVWGLHIEQNMGRGTKEAP